MENKAILMSIQPQWVCKILNGEKTIEVRKKFPKDYVGWVYIYCTKYIGKHGENQLLNFFKENEYFIGRDIDHYDPNDICYLGQNGKVVARFWCDKVEEIECRGSYGNYEGIELNDYYTETMDEKELFTKSCLKLKGFNDYLDNGKQIGYAIRISRLEVFDKPKELKEFYKVGAWQVYEEQFDSSYLKRTEQEIMEELGQTITKAPQSWCYVEEKL